MRIQIENGSHRKRAWQATLISGGGYQQGHAEQFTSRLEVDAESLLEIDLLLPMTSPSAAYYLNGTAYTRTGVLFRGPGSRPKHWHLYSSPSVDWDPGGGTTGFFLLSASFGQATWRHLTEHFRDGGKPLAGGRVSVANLPIAAPAYYGVESIWLKSDDLDEMPETARPALMEWLARGGRLHVADPDADLHIARLFPELPLPTSEQPLRFYGAGGIITFSLDEDGNLDLAAFETATEERPSALLVGVGLPLKDRPGLLRGLELPELPAPAVLGFLLVFAILVGPVNFFFLAPKRARLRLFFTTPLISAGAGLLALALIIWIDGTKITANRMGFLLWNGDTGEHYLAQVQAGVSGMLLNTGFENQEVTWATFLPENEILSPLNRTAEGYYSGGWFTSRALQGQYVTQTIQAEGGLEIAVEAGQPEVRTSFPFPVDDLFYVDESGNWWRTGNPADADWEPMQPSNPATFDSLIEPYGPHFHAKALDIAVRGNVFFAFSRAPETSLYLADFGPNMEWAQNVLLIAGRPAVAEGRSVSSSGCPRIWNAPTRMFNDEGSPKWMDSILACPTFYNCAPAPGFYVRSIPPAGRDFAAHVEFTTALPLRTGRGQAPGGLGSRTTAMVLRTSPPPVMVTPPLVPAPNLRGGPGGPPSHSNHAVRTPREGWSRRPPGPGSTELPHSRNGAAFPKQTVFTLI